MCAPVLLMKGQQLGLGLLPDRVPALLRRSCKGGENSHDEQPRAGHGYTPRLRPRTLRKVAQRKQRGRKNKPRSGGTVPGQDNRGSRD
jgi:hypothetical protein